MRFVFSLTVLLGMALEARPDEVPSIKVVLRGAPEPRPALRYQLLPPENQSTPGNAALVYCRAMSPEWNRVLFSPERSKKMEPWDTIPAKDLPIDEVRAFLMEANAPLREVDRAARCLHCDWELDVRINQDGASLLLPEIQGMRTLARVLKLRAKLELAEKRFDDAIRTIQTGFAMGRHIGNGPTLIHSLVGIAVVSMFAQTVDEWIDMNRSPNLYWAASGLPRPYLDFRRPLSGELRMVESLFTPLDQVERGPLSTEEANRLLERTIEKLSPFMSPGESIPNRGILATYVALVYPRAKKYLVEGGMKVEEVDAMPVAQVVLLAGSRQFHILRDELFKWTTVPYADAYARFKEVEQKQKQLREQNKTDVGIQLYLMIVPSIDRVLLAGARLDRKIAAIRTIEAIRLHLVANPGKLPEKLEDITVVPVPLDPMTGKPFRYSVEGNKATLIGPPPGMEKPSASNSLSYELFLAP